MARVIGAARDPDSGAPLSGQTAALKDIDGGGAVSGGSDSTDANGIYDISLNMNPVGQMYVEVVGTGAAAGVTRRLAPVAPQIGPYFSAELPVLFQLFGDDGVIDGYGNELACTPGTGRAINVGTGACFAKGMLGVQYSAADVAVTENASGNPRIDRVVVRFTRTEGNDWGKAVVTVITGTAAADPDPPDITQNADTWDVPLCQVAVANGASSFDSGDITDEREIVGHLKGAYVAGGTDVALADGGTGASLSDPNADRILFWDDSAGAVTWLAPGTGLAISGTTLGLDEELQDIAGLTPTDGNFIVGNGSSFVTESGDTAIASLGITATAAELNTLDGITASTAELNVLDGITASTAELNFVDGVTSAIQTQLDAKQPLDAGLTAIAGLSDPNADRILFWDDSAGTWAHLTVGTGLSISNTTISATGGGTPGEHTHDLADIVDVTASAAEVNVLDGITATTTELNYVDGVTSAIQTQLDAKAPKASPTFTGTVTAATITASGTVTGADLAATDDLTVGDDATIGGTLSVSGNTDIVGGRLLVKGNDSSQFIVQKADGSHVIQVRLDSSIRDVNFDNGVRLRGFSDDTSTETWRITTADGDAQFDGDLSWNGALDHNGSTVGFFSAEPTTKPTVSGSRGGNAALESLLTALANLGLITNNTS